MKTNIKYWEKINDKGKSLNKMRDFYNERSERLEWTGQLHLQRQLMLTIKPSHSINNPTAFIYRKYNEAIVININIQNTRLVNWSIQGWSEENNSNISFHTFGITIYYPTLALTKMDILYKFDFKEMRLVFNMWSKLT